MIAAGQITPVGLAAIKAAKANGGWTRLDAVEALAVPADLAAALAGRPPAASNFEAFPRSVKRGILEWIAQAKRPETRARRVEETARRAARNERANQWKPRR
ncbi:MAG: YdeI/OmpD-associated family protein [Kiloniellales bacterium]|nr:YdeI/OmpD-associated family protein [Kiloniellales bacterium]